MTSISLAERGDRNFDFCAGKTQKIKFNSNKRADKCDPVKLLGIVLYSSLTWASHVDYLRAKLSSQIFALRQLKYCVDNSTLRTVYYSLIHKSLIHFLKDSREISIDDILLTSFIKDFTYDLRAFDSPFSLIERLYHSRIL
nr:unnamed protein product [Callosobruchus chinensis]